MSSPCRILYVDDDKDSCQIVRVMLTGSDDDYVVITAESAKEGLLLILKEKFDLYIFDYWMPEISGIDLCRCVRQFDSHTPVLFFSALARPIDIAKAKEAGANEYLIKPYGLDKLSETVKGLLEESFLVRNRQTIITRIVELERTASEQVLSPATRKDLFQKSTVNSLKRQSKRIRKTNNQITDKKFNPHQIQTGRDGKSRSRALLVGTAFFAVFFLHFISQFSFFQSNDFLNNQNSVNIEKEQTVEIERQNKQIIEAETRYEAKNSDTEAIPKKVTPSLPPKPKIAISRTGMKKQEPRESKAERLRRAERILTGV